MNTTILHTIKYKNSPLGLIPEDWEVKTLGEVTGYIKGFAFSSSDYTTEGVRIIRISDTTSNSIKEEGAIYMNTDDAPKYKKWELKLNDLVFTTVGSRPPMYDSMVGKVIKIENKYKGSLLNQNAVIIRSKEFTNQEFVFNQFKVKRYLDFIETIVRGNANQVSITLDNLFKYQLLFPPLPEQAAIAICLSTWDKAIEKQTALIAQKELSKKALMQQLLSGKKRLKGFSGKWKGVRFGDIFTRITQKNSEKNTNVVTISAQRGFVRQNDFFNKIVASDILDNYFLVSKGDFCYNKSYSNGYSWGATKRLNDFEKAVVTTLYICFGIKDENKNSGDFFEQYFGANLLDKGLTKIAHEGGRAHGLLNVTPIDFFGLNIIIPQFEEQTAIADVLQCADDEVQLLKKKLYQLKEQKKGLMQILLTGKKRLKY